MKNILLKGLFISASVVFITSSASAMTCTNLTKSLSRGQENSEVLSLQQFLFDGGYLTAKPNGYFSAGTVTALKKFQITNGMSPVGTVGPKTRGKVKEVSCGASNSASAATASDVSKKLSTETSKLATYKTDSKNDQFDNAQKFIKLYLASIITGDDPGHLKMMEKRDEAFSFKDSLHLNKMQEIDFARNLVNSENGLIIYMGANTLYFAGKEDEGSLSFANVIISGKDKTDLNGRMGYDWAHMLDGKEISRIFFGMYRSMVSHFDEYGSIEQKKIIKILCSEIKAISCDQSLFNKEAALKTLNELQKESELKAKQSEGGNTSSVNQLADSRNSNRNSDVYTILTGVTQYAVDTNGVLPLSITSVPTEICFTASISCSGMVDLSALNGKYIAIMPKDPQVTTTNGTGYMISKSASGRVTVTASLSEQGKIISVTK